MDSDIKRDRLRGPLQGIPYGAKDLLHTPSIPPPGARNLTPARCSITTPRARSIRKHGGVLTGSSRWWNSPAAAATAMPAASLTGPGRIRGTAALVRRFFERLGDRRGRGPGDLRARLGNVRLHPHSQRLLRRHRPAPHLRTGCRHGAMALSWTLDKIGPFCRSAEDCGLVLEAIAGGDRR